MDVKALSFILAAFVLGVCSTVAVTDVLTTDEYPTTTTTYVQREETQDDNFVTRILGGGNAELPSPHDRIKERDIKVEGERVIISVDNPRWARFTDTNSMDPVIDIGANAIQIIPQDEKDIFIGDVISYSSRYADGTIIHRVIDIGYDEDGWYAIVKGDNNARQDPGRIRFSQIKRVLVAVIY